MGIRENLHIRATIAIGTRCWSAIPDCGWTPAPRAVAGTTSRPCAGRYRCTTPMSATASTPIKQLQHREMFEWIPHFRAHTMNWDTADGTYGNTNLPLDEFAFQNAMAPAMTCMVEWNDTPHSSHWHAA